MKAKVCFYSVATQLGGAEQSLLEYLKYSVNRLDAELLVPSLRGPLVEEAQRIGIHCVELPMPSALLRGSRSRKLSLARSIFSLETARYFIALVKHWRRTRPSLIYTTGLKCHLWAALASLFTGTPVLWHLRDHFQGPMAWIFRSVKALSPRVQVVANSRSTATSFRPKTAPPVIYNGVAAADFPFARGQALRQELGLPKETRLVGILGVLAHWKGQDDFLRMAAELLKREPGRLHFAVVGDQIYDTSGDAGYGIELRTLAANLGIESHVSFLGFRRDTAQILQSLDVLVHASKRPEPFGRVIIEAMACGTPVTASAAGGPLEILQAEVSGLLHPCENWRAMADNVQTLLRPDRAQAIRQRAREEFQARFTHDRYAQALHEMVTRSLNS